MIALEDLGINLPNRFSDSLAFGPALANFARERILIADGAMGTEIWGLKLNGAQFRGQRFAACRCDQKGNNGLLILTQPEAVEEICFPYAMAGADIFESNTLSSTFVAQAD